MKPPGLRMLSDAKRRERRGPVAAARSSVAASRYPGSSDRNLFESLTERLLKALMR